MGGSVQADEWVVLAEQDPESALLETDSGLLFLEAVLQEEGIATMFDPHRPGEWISAGYGGRQQARLLVMQQDLERAKQILVDLESSETVEAEDDADSGIETTADEDDEWYESEDVAAEPLSLDVDPRLASFKPPMDKAINPGCATLLLPMVVAVALVLVL